jgi:hypothetical protein
MDIAPGTKVTVKVTSTIKNAAAAKTLGRLFLKDPAIAARRRKTPKDVVLHQRGGRMWRQKAKGTVCRPPALGQSATLVATVDVIRDLASVSRFVDVSPA